jgi:hypothetical protein
MEKAEKIKLHSVHDLFHQQLIETKMETKTIMKLSLNGKRERERLQK